ncbi:glycosyltransferase [Chryseobacterium koreense]|uniref:glycosyltransferase n=1 Tax=Chryseobacterium koreense TaxID=232216 RepID=UPI0026E9A8F9|nr:glycosyltransferase [Chryseobacterium koreense]
MDKEKVHRKDPKIKLLFRHRSMEMGGVEKVMLSLLHNLDREKFEMTVLLNLNQGELRDEIPNHVRKVFLAEGKEDFSNNYLIQKLQLFLRKRKLQKFRKNPEIIDKEILKENFDIEIAMTYNDFESVLNSSNKKSKKVGWFHSEIHLPKLQPLVPKILEHFPQFDYMVYCSARIKDLMHEHYPNLDYPPESVIINAIPIEEIKRKADFPESEAGTFGETPNWQERENPNSENRIPQFMSIGRLHSRKGYHKLMDAHAKLLLEGFEHSVLIIGDGEELPNLLEQQKKLGVEKTFVFAGNKMNPYPDLKNADFFIMPSESEAWPLVIAEALILQKPIIATKVGDVETMIENQKTGYLIHYDTDEIYSAMKEFLTNKKMVSEIKQNLVEIEKQFDNNKVFAEIEKIFVNLVQSKI